MVDGGRPPEREPSLQETAISITDPHHRARLQLQLSRFRSEMKPLRQLHPRLAERFFQQADHNRLRFKESILRHSLQISAERDTALDPIVITEIALAVEDETGAAVAGAAAVPFRPADQPDAIIPDYRRMVDNPVVVDFLEAYNVIRIYANGVPGLIGESLPELPPGAAT
jgi:hypothetical protein